MPSPLTWTDFYLAAKAEGKTPYDVEMKHQKVFQPLVQLALNQLNLALIADAERPDENSKFQFYFVQNLKRVLEENPALLEMPQPNLTLTQFFFNLDPKLYSHIDCDKQEEEIREAHGEMSEKMCDMLDFVTRCMGPTEKERLPEWVHEVAMGYHEGGQSIQDRQEYEAECQAKEEAGDISD